jgi:nicotinamide riboside transporter PnuC
MSDYKLPPLMKGFEISLTVFSMLGAAVMSQGYWEGYYAYLIANVCGITLFTYTKWWASLARNLVFLTTTLVGMYNTL